MKSKVFSAQSKFLLVRPDKIGDLILTLPALQALRQTYPQSHISFLCSAYAADILKNNPFIDQVLQTQDPDLLNKIKQQQFDVAIHFYVESGTTRLTKKAKIPYRIGPFSKFAALHLNKWILQHRSRVEKHEAEYNCDLVAACAAKIVPQVPKIFLSAEEVILAKKTIAGLGISSPCKIVFIHPGSAGSASRWPLNHFIELGHRLAAHDCKVIFTGGEQESQILAQARITYQKNVIVTKPGEFSLRELIGLISQGQLFVANSTGPLHIASALGVPTLSFYPLLPKVTSAARWAPFGNSEKNVQLSPENENFSMETILVKDALSSALKLLEP